MPAVTLGPSGEVPSAHTPLGLRRRYFGLALKLVLRLWAPAAGVLAVVSAAGCDSSQYVLFTLQNLPATGTVSVHTSYTLDSSPGKTGIARVAPPANQFALLFSSDTRGTLNANVRAYTYVAPGQCFKSEAAPSVTLNGSYKQELATAMPDGRPIPCDATQVPATFPPTDAAPLASWGSSASNIWVVGDKGMIQYWNGTAFAQIPLPPDLSADPPTWRAVAGADSKNVWVAGDRGVIARWDGTNLTTVGLVAQGGGTFTPGSDGQPGWVSLAVENAAMDEVFFVSSNGYIGHNSSSTGGVETFNAPPTFPEYPPSGNTISAPMSTSVSFSDIYCIAINECWFVGYDPKRFVSGDQSGGGAIFQVYNQSTFSDYSMSNLTPTTPVTRGRLRGVWGTPYVLATTVRKLYLVGDNGAVLFSNNTGLNTSPDVFPKFQTEYTTVATTTLTGRSLQLNAIRGTSPSDLWIAGNAGVLMRWDPLPALPGNPFIVVTTGVTANLTSVFSTGPDIANGRVYASGDQQTFISP